MTTISNFKANLTGGGARPNQFRVSLKFPEQIKTGLMASEKAQFLCSGASLPASTIQNIELRYRGRQVNVSGEREFEPWTITVYNDTDFAIRNAFEEWSNLVAKYGETCGTTNPLNYQTDAIVEQLSRCDDVLKSYQFIDVYPTTVSEIELNFENGTQIETFTVTLQYNYFIPSKVG